MRVTTLEPLQGDRLRFSAIIPSFGSCIGNEPFRVEARTDSELRQRIREGLPCG